MTKIAFLGTSLFSVPILNRIIKRKIDILTVFTQPPNKSKRGQKILKSPVHTFSDSNGLNVRTPKNIDKDYKFINDNNLDLGIVVSYGQLIPKNIIDKFKFGLLNVHASLLPKYRGAAPIQRSIINSEKITGISIMKVNEKLDNGPVCNQYQIKIDKNDNYLSLSKKLSHLGADKIVENIKLVLSNKAIFIKQNHSEATYAKKIIKSEGKIQWNENAKKICAKVNGLYPSPGAWFEFKNERYKILKSETSLLNGKPGEVLDNILTVGCGINSIRILELQKQGKKPQKTKDFLLGSKIKLGSFLRCD